MEQNQSVLAKKVWSMVRVAYYMLREGISKRKLLLDLNMMVKRGKIAGKAMHNLMFHNHKFTTKHHSHDSVHLSFPSPPRTGYELSCTNSPATSNNNKKVEDLDIMAINAVLMKAMALIQSENASPVLPGFGRSPMVRELRVTDSPFPSSSSVDEDSHVVDEAAERFINQFYNDLRRQDTKASFDSL
ncbi:hypothetical protein CTI12_AA592890 [Artemisia annua]|uniref:Avr9/Cf-9 rapidly elicited protein 146 n=1 Tax=Artemisia annua TaxID=35608 RepID=A0A2U1KK80_ARTAN|nr:hypothetical protein CTI12_AA592890 [Artemisia annua]